MNSRCFNHFLMALNRFPTALIFFNNFIKYFIIIIIIFIPGSFTVVLASGSFITDFKSFFNYFDPFIYG